MIIYSLLLMTFYYKEGCAQFHDNDSEEYVKHKTWHIDEHAVRNTANHHINARASRNNVAMDESEMEYKMEVIQLFKKQNKLQIASDDFMDMKHDITHPDIGNATMIPRGIHFSPFVRKHMEAVLDLIHYFLKAETTGDLVEMGHRVRDLVNERMFKFALSNVLSIKKFGVEFPAIFEASPEDFIPDKFVRAINKKHKQIHEEIDLMKNKTRHTRQLGSRPSITWRELERGVYEVNYKADLSASDRDLESRVSYFREDYGVNSHHYNWHLVHLDDRSRERWQVVVPKRDQYFMYVHLQMLARYNFERLSCRLPLTEPYGANIRLPIEEGHTPNLGHDSGEYAIRRPNTAPRNQQIINRVENLRRQLYEGLSRRIVNDEMFLETLELYHNDGHLLISLTHEEPHRGNQRVGVMFASQASMRDPVFYRYHQYIEDFYQRYLDMKLAQGIGQNTYDDLEEEDLVIRYVDVSSTLGPQGSTGEVVTGCNTFSMEATYGFDFDGNEQVFVSLSHLDHIPFNYHIGVENRGPRVHGMVRIFLAPLLNDRGRPMGFEEQRKLWIEMDKFIHVFSRGRNEITRGSAESTVAVNCRNTFRDITERITNPHGQLTDSGHCGCGWPQHKLLPRGWGGDGMPVQLFVMVTNEEHIDHSRPASRSTYCGIPGVEQPDRKPMGYPFHNAPPTGTRTIHDLHQRLANAFVKKIRIRYSGRQVDPDKADSPDCPQMESPSRNTSQSQDSMESHESSPSSAQHSDSWERQESPPSSHQRQGPFSSALHSESQEREWTFPMNHPDSREMNSSSPSNHHIDTSGQQVSSPDPHSDTRERNGPSHTRNPDSWERNGMPSNLHPDSQERQRSSILHLELQERHRSSPSNHHLDFRDKQRLSTNHLVSGEWQDSPPADHPNSLERNELSSSNLQPDSRERQRSSTHHPDPQERHRLSTSNNHPDSRERQSSSTHHLDSREWQGSSPTDSWEMSRLSSNIHPDSRKRQRSSSSNHHPNSQERRSSSSHHLDSREWRNTSTHHPKLTERHSKSPSIHQLDSREK